MSFEERSLEEREAASIVAGLSSATRNIDVDVVEPAGAKRSRDDDNADKKKPARKKKAAAKKPRKEPPMDATGRIFAAELRPPPYFYYTDHASEPDDDPLVPLTSAGSVPTFPASECTPSVSIQGFCCTEFAMAANVIYLLQLPPH